ncbi:MAG: nickel-dependent hydrogenase large subunit [Burkholderiales bacterium]|nr:nickel-dependent hydrogenase large subunit [Burkholderiales bacterium]
MEGRIGIGLGPTVEGRRWVRLTNERPLAVQGLLTGCTAQEAVARVGLLFSLCRQAQRAACAAALQAAAGRSERSDPGGPVRRQLLTELAREHLRLLLGAPAGRMASGAAQALRPLAAEGAVDLWRALRDVLSGLVLGEPPQIWLARDAQGWLDWCRQRHTAPARLLDHLLDIVPPDHPHTGLLPNLASWRREHAAAIAVRCLADARFCRQPEWAGAPAETGALARWLGEARLQNWLDRFGRGPAVRVLARLLELASLAEWLAGEGPPLVRAWTLDEGTGVAAAETARGLLLHVVRLRAGRVRDYRIIAPTEWNFHPRGVLWEQLLNLPWPVPPDRLHAQTQALVAGLDPCVDWYIESAHHA